MKRTDSYDLTFWINAVEFFNGYDYTVDEELYEDKFDTSSYTLEEIQDIYDGYNSHIEVQHLNDYYKNKIKDVVLDNSTRTRFQDKGDVYEKCFYISGLGHVYCNLSKPSDDFVGFNPFDDSNNNRDTLEDFVETALNSDGYDIELEVDDTLIHQVFLDEDSLSFSDGYVTGFVSVNGEYYSFDYNTETEEYDFHAYSEPGYLTGACYETELPSEFKDSYNLDYIMCTIDRDVISFANEHINDTEEFAIAM